MEYVITNGTRFVKQDVRGKYKLVTNSAIADMWDKKEKAESVLFNSVPPYMRYSLYVAELKNGVVEQETLSKKQIIECREQVKEDNDSYELSKYSFDDDEEIQKMIRGFDDVRNVLINYATEKSHRHLEEKTMYMNYAVEDIKHYHGRKALNARDGFKLNKLEDKAIIKRISVKNQLEISKKLNKHCKDILEQINDICDTIECLRNQRYVPRVLSDLFENDNLDIEF